MTKKQASAQDKLWAIAVEHHGYVTARDAFALKLTRKALDGLIDRGQLERVAFGVYRFPQFPESPYDPYMLAVLWTGTPGACLSHETALEAYGLSDILSDCIHVTVPCARRIRRAGGGSYCVHRQDLAPRQVGWWEGIPAVTLPTAIAQCIDCGTPTYLIRQAIIEGRKRGDLLPEEAEQLDAELKARDEQS